MAHSDNLSIGVFIDGGYFAKIDEGLAKKLKALKTHAILLTWDPAGTGSTSRFLSEEVCTHIDIMRLASKEQDILKKLTIL